MSFSKVAVEELAEQTPFLQDDPTTDLALVFSEFTPDGELLPLSWVRQLQRLSTEPLTYIRVSRDAASDVTSCLKGDLK